MVIYYRTLRCAFIQTIPVLMGYSTMGFAFGVLLNKAGFHPFWALLMSVTILSGSLQFAAVSMMSARLPIFETILMSFVINIRYSMYGLSLIEIFKSCGLKKYYMIFCLTDETYALEVLDDRPPEVDRNIFMFLIGLLNQSYWIIGCTSGAITGSLIDFNAKGIDFAMTALFLVILVEQFEVKSNRVPIYIGLGSTVVGLLLFGKSQMLLVSMAIFTIVFIIFKKKIEAYNDK